METLRYFSIGSHPSNALQLADDKSAPFHALLYNDGRGHILVANRASQHQLFVNGAPHKGLVELHAGDQLSIDAQAIDWMQIFGVKPEERIELEVKEQNNISVQRGMRVQLVLIYVAVAIMLILLAVYI